MEYLDALLLMRMVERLLGLLAGGLCIVLGYRLFMKLPDKTDSSGKVVLPGGVSIWLSRVGPGLFFALFGAAIVAYSFTSAVKVTNEQTGPSARAPACTAAETPATSRQEIAAMSDRSTEQARREARQQRLMVLRGTLVDLNATIDRLGRDAASPDRDRLIVGLQMAKVLLLRGAWDAAWGDPDRFQSWINSGALPPAPAAMDEPAGLYLAGQTR